ncbi:RNA polymerase-associated protein RapA [Brevifollis gellanilyticus]|uniref:RNA polymerase-associated protein RapA n=1 Tax=Brevifollis gellanilyticus TaxID=748831 RepID=A0A512MFT1_9BACT|nr:RNA polymerase-associated protein RapA [Brevifollis gellanilyticus]GEP45556.1 RNA polymerase-associated protein RapA [Brevifollis gellanilyticus]
MDQPLPGQRWVSNNEPELGLGVVMKAQYGRIELFFPAAGEMRQYSLTGAPLRRVRFQPGDTIKTHEGKQIEVESTEERQGMLFYIGNDGEISEAELADTISFSKPEDRLMASQIDELTTFDLRVEALQRRAQIRQSAVRGFCGGRVDLLPHQMFIANEVGSRLVPRVLLADEVGLGKTIEAGLILHRLHLTGRAERVLILVPDALVHQWFVELYRRFNLRFSIFDEARCDEIETSEEDANPFLESQLVICSTSFLAKAPNRAAQVEAAGWDLLIVDEAHHLEWSTKEASPSYTMVEALASKIQGLLLLTATPQQLGPEGHFARLRLLDANRYADLAQFLEETKHYEEVASAVDKLLGGKNLTAADQKVFAKKSPHVQELAVATKAGTEGAREKLVAALLDEFGTGRVMFRNTRAALSGFPERKAHLAPIEAGDDPIEAKVKWLAALLKKHGEQKVLLICRTKKLAEDIHERLVREINVTAALFHEGLTLMQRDRQAAFFAEEEEGARILLCSEIGSEGRNFQFAHHLVLFDLPQDPELLEQRIGRLDRIGQTSTIHVHVPYLKGTGEEVLARWYDDGLNAFEKNLHGATEIAQGLRESLKPLMEDFSEKGLTAFLKETKTLRSQVTKKLERGHDRLLELNSCKPEQAETVIDVIRKQDADDEFEEFFVRLADHFGLEIEEMENRSYVFKRGDLITDAFPSLPEEGLTVTFDRQRAITRENIAFLTIDHPIVRGALDLLLSGEAGNSGFAAWRGCSSEGLILETHYVVEVVAPAALHADRFLAPAPIRVVVDHANKDLRADSSYLHAKLDKSNPTRLLEKAPVRKKLFPAMMSASRKIAEAEMQKLVTEATATMKAQIQAEIDRLEDLRQLNDHVRPEEIEALKAQITSLEEAIGGARIRLDALMLVLQSK